MVFEKVLIADDEQIMRKFLEETLRRKRIDVDTAETGREAIRMLESENSYDLLITDIKMPGTSGIEVLKRAKELYPDMPVVMMTAYGTVENAVEAMKIGAEDYLLKPFSPDQIELILKRIQDKCSLVDENKYLRSTIDSQYGFGEVVGTSSTMTNIYDMVQKVAQSKATVLIQGESGTGKELIARAIHYNSPRRNRPFVKVNCAALSETLLESELFGHEKGSFTGALGKRQGRFELAHTGTILLDEISEISMGVQAKLLRVLQEREFERVGGSKSIQIDTRVISTTNKDLKKAIADGEFREDLYFRLNVVPVQLPPLRERCEDVPLLVESFLEKFNSENQRKNVKISDRAMDMLVNYNWPGNVRELENLIERLVVLDLGQTIAPEHLPQEIAGAVNKSQYAPVQSFGVNQDMAPRALSDVERDLILSTLRTMSGNRTKTAQTLGISVRTLRNKLGQYKADPEIAALV